MARCEHERGNLQQTSRLSSLTSPETAIKPPTRAERQRKGGRALALVTPALSSCFLDPRRSHLWTGTVHTGPAGGAREARGPSQAPSGKNPGQRASQRPQGRQTVHRAPAAPAVSPGGHAAGSLHLGLCSHRTGECGSCSLTRCTQSLPKEVRATGTAAPQRPHGERGPGCRLASTETAAWTAGPERRTPSATNTPERSRRFTHEVTQ